VKRFPSLENFLQQNIDECATLAEARQALHALVGGRA